MFSYESIDTILGTCYSEYEYFTPFVFLSKHLLKNNRHSSTFPSLQCCVPRVNSHLLLVPVLQKLHVAAPLAVSSPQGGAAMHRQVRRRGHTPALRVHPGVNVVGDVAAWNPPDWSHREAELFIALQHLRRGESDICNSNIRNNCKFKEKSVIPHFNLCHWFQKALKYAYINTFRVNKHGEVEAVNFKVGHIW